MVVPLINATVVCSIENCRISRMMLKEWKKEFLVVNYAAFEYVFEMEICNTRKRIVELQYVLSVYGNNILNSE